MRVIVMKKPEENNRRLRFGKSLGIAALLMAAAFLLQACEKMGLFPESTGLPAGDNRVILFEENTPGREVILVRGNEWGNGIPGFESNGFPALMGEYRIRTQEAEKSGQETRFLAYLCPEPLYFSDYWQRRAGPAGISSFKRDSEEGFLIAAILDDGMDALWTAVFRFPAPERGPGGDKAALTDEAFNQMLRVWTNKFFYFLYLTKNHGELSLPAVVEF